MGLLNDVKATNEAPKAKQVAEAVEPAKTDKKAKAKERKAAKREALAHVLDYLKKNPVEAIKADVELLTKAPVREGGFVSAFTAETLFGDKTRINAVEVFTKFKKGYPEMKKYMKKWAEKGVKVTLDAATQDYVWEKK